jgi:hypothetical protein
MYYKSRRCPLLRRCPHRRSLCNQRKPPMAMEIEEEDDDYYGY